MEATHDYNKENCIFIFKEVSIHLLYTKLYGHADVE